MTVLVSHLGDNGLQTQNGTSFPQAPLSETGVCLGQPARKKVRLSSKLIFSK